MRSRAIVCTVTVFLLCAVTGSAEPSPGNTVPIPDKNSTPTGKPTYEGRVEGETIEDPFVIDWLPFMESGDTCPFLNDYDEACPYDGSLSPDVVYRYDCVYDCGITIDLCASSYDTKVYVYENEYTPGSPLACNDDSAYCADIYRSWISTEFVCGNTYYVVVDGYGTDCGAYDLYIVDHVPCVQCPADAFVEGEPECMDPMNDIHNGGCNEDPPVFDYLEPGDESMHVCGTSGTYVVGNSNWRDTDWYQIDLASESEIGIRCLANFPVRIGFVDGREGCEGVSAFYSFDDASPCEAAIVNEILGPGTWWVWVGPVGFEGVPCGEEYVFELTGYTTVTPVEDASWSTIKALYR